MEKCVVGVDREAGGEGGKVANLVERNVSLCGVQQAPSLTEMCDDAGKRNDSEEKEKIKKMLSMQENTDEKRLVRIE